jgi:hypothetical protein
MGVGHERGRTGAEGDRVAEVEVVGRRPGVAPAIGRRPGVVGPPAEDCRRGGAESKVGSVAWLGPPSGGQRLAAGPSAACRPARARLCLLGGMRTGADRPPADGRFPWPFPGPQCRSSPARLRRHPRVAADQGRSKVGVRTGWVGAKSSKGGHRPPTSCRGPRIGGRCPPYKDFFSASGPPGAGAAGASVFGPIAAGGLTGSSGG